MDPDTGVDIPVTYYGTNSMQNPTVTAFARGGFVPANASFVSPSQSLWTAGEAGKRNRRKLSRQDYSYAT